MNDQQHEESGRNASALSVRPTSEKHCYACGTVLHFSAAQCPRCGAVQPAGNPPSSELTRKPGSISHGVFCRGCGATIHQDASTCPKCGAPQAVASVQRKSRVTAGVLGILLGGIGAHKFYMGRWTGLLYLLFVWTYIPMIIGLIEGIYYLTLSDDEFARKYQV